MICQNDDFFFTVNYKIVYLLPVNKGVLSQNTLDRELTTHAARVFND